MLKCYIFPFLMDKYILCRPVSPYSNKKKKTKQKKPQKTTGK